MRHFLQISDVTASELTHILKLGAEDVGPIGAAARSSSKGIACYFEKPSARTRNSTEMAAISLGRHPVYITRDEVGIGTRESVGDVVRTLACYHDAICARVFDHGLLEEMAEVGAVPVVNLLSDFEHPLQAVADLLTIQDNFGELDGLKLAYVGDSNNVTRSLAKAALLCGMAVGVASPSGHSFSEPEVAQFQAAGDFMGSANVGEIVGAADVVYTDTWVSMGQESEAEARLVAFDGYQVTAALMKHAKPNAIFMHCLPAHRGEEVTDDVLDGASSRIWQQAANRQRAAAAVLSWILETNRAP